MTGILKIAYKLLVNNKGKFAALLIGITFAVFLMIQMTSMFAGMMRKASATVTNTGAKVWVMDKAVTSVASSIPMSAQADAVHAAFDALHLTHINYQAGIATYLQLLIADEQYHQATLAYVQAQAQRLQDTVALYVALGGGWWSVQK